MGNNQSLPSDISREKLSELTTDTRYIMDKILEFMITELSIRDFVSISDKTQCDKYVLFKANVLYKYFDQLQIMPSMDKSGVIAFRKFDDIRKSQGDSNERQSLCLIIAYYYTRIFQIYGALALTLIDDMETATKTGIFSTRTAPGFEGVPNIFRGGQRGGDLSREEADRLKEFAFLSTYLDKSESYTRFYTKYLPNPIEFERNYSNTFKIWYGKNRKKTASINIRVTGSPPYNFTITLNDLRYTMSKQGRPTHYSRSTASYDDKKFQSKMAEWGFSKINGTFDVPKKVYTINGKTVSEFFNNLFDKIIQFIEVLSKEGDVETTGLTKSKHDELDIKKVYDIIKVDNKVIRPRAHCIARALQLLQTSPLGKSFVCDSTFDYKKSGLPIRNQPISTSNGISSLANLFYDTIQNRSIKIGINPTTNDKSTFDKYINFMKNMAKLFDTDTYNTIDKNPKYITLSSIINKRDDTLCKKIGNGEIDLDKNTADSVNNNVKALFKIQYAHAIRCGDIFNQMFNIQRDKGSDRVRIKLSNNIYRIGFPEIERINNLTRNVLVDYYSNCENEYMRGVQKIIDSKKPAAPVAPVAEPATAPATAPVVRRP